MDKINEELVKKLKATLEEGVSDDTIKHATKLADEMAERIKDNVVYGLKDNLAHELAAWTEEMAGDAVKMLLAGNEDQMRRYLSCEKYGWNGRSDGHHYGNRSATDWHPVIHGKLFEQGCVELRKKIVDAHRELLVNERILDLEDQVKALVAQINKVTAEKQSALERLRQYL